MSRHQRQQKSYDVSKMIDSLLMMLANYDHVVTFQAQKDTQVLAWSELVRAFCKFASLAIALSTCMFQLIYTMHMDKQI
jgi:hypothetical protein